MNKNKAEKIAQEIADELFHIAPHHKASHLERKDTIAGKERSCGSWSHNAVVDLIAECLRKKGW